MQKPSRSRDSPTYLIEGISGEAPSAFPKGQMDLTHTLLLFAGFQSWCTLTRQALWSQNTGDTDACWSLWLQASRMQTFVNYGWLLPQFYTDLSFVEPLHEYAFILSLKPPQFCCSESHSFGKCSLWSPYLLLIMIILCDNSTWRSLSLYLTKEPTHVRSVTLFQRSSQEMGIVVAQWHPLEDSSVTMDCSWGPALSSNTAASFSAPQPAASCGGTPALSICINYGRLSTTSAIVSFSIVVNYYHMKKLSYQKCIKINISCIISEVSEIRLTAFQSRKRNYNTKNKQNKSYIQADFFSLKKCKFTDDIRKSVVLFFSM